MTATEVVRCLLDERRVEYRTHGTTDRTWFEVGHISWFIIESEDGSLTANAVYLTPEQAIAATLGRGECHDTGESRWFHCSKCGFGMIDLYTDGDWSEVGQNLGCPNYGAKVVSDG